MLHPSCKISPLAVTESSAIQWILATSTEPEVRRSAIELIPSVQWTVTLAAASLGYVERHYWSREDPQRDLAAIMARVHLAVICKPDSLGVLYIDAGTSQTSREFLLVKQALLFFRHEEILEMALDVIDQMDLTDPWLSHVFPFLLQYRKKRWGLSQPIVLRATLALEGCVRQAHLSHTEEILANALVSMAILLHVEVDSELLIMRNKSFHPRPIIGSILMALRQTLFTSKVIDRKPLDEKVELALRILPIFAHLSESMVNDYWYYRFLDSLSNYTDRNNTSIWGIRSFFSLLPDCILPQKHTYARSFLSLALSTLDPLSEHVRCDILTLSNQIVSLDNTVQYMLQFREDQPEDKIALCDILFITGTMNWEMMDPNLDVSHYLGQLIRCIRLTKDGDGSGYIPTVSHFGLRALSALEDHHITNERNRWLTPDLSRSLLAIKGNRLSYLLGGIRLHKWSFKQGDAFMKSEGYTSILYLRFIFRMMQYVDWYHSVLSDGHLERVMGFIQEIVEMSTQKNPDWLRDRDLEQHLKLIPRILERTWAGAPHALTRLTGHKNAIKGLIEQSWYSAVIWSQGCRTSFRHLNISSEEDLMESTTHLIRLTSYWVFVWNIEDLPALTGAVQKMKEEVEADLLQFRYEPETDGLVKETILPDISRLIERLQNQWLRVSNKTQSHFPPKVLSVVEEATEESLE